MTRTKLGLNWHKGNLDAAAKERGHYITTQLQSPSVVVTNDPSFAHEIANRHPDVTVWLRMVPNGMVLGEDDVHKTPPFDVEPWRYLDLFAPHVPGPKGNIGVYIENEPQPAESEKLVAWLVTVGRMCVQRGWKAVLGNFSVGTPNEIGFLQTHKPLWELCAKNKDLLRLGLHEYIGDTTERSKPYFVGRAFMLIEAAQRAGWDIPLFEITETGFDWLPIEPSGKIREIMLKWGIPNPQDKAWAEYLQQYQLYARSPHITGVHIFTYGHNDEKWRATDINGLGTFVNRMLAETGSVPHMFADEATQDPPQPDTLPAGEYTIELFTASSWNFRSVPTLEGSRLGRLFTGRTIELTGKTVQADGYTWYEAAYSGRVGWFAYVETAMNLLRDDDYVQVKRSDLDKLRTELQAQAAQLQTVRDNLAELYKLIDGVAA